MTISEASPVSSSREACARRQDDRPQSALGRTDAGGLGPLLRRDSQHTPMPHDRKEDFRIVTNAVLFYHGCELWA